MGGGRTESVLLKWEKQVVVGGYKNSFPFVFILTMRRGSEDEEEEEETTPTQHWAHVCVRS